MATHKHKRMAAPCPKAGGEYEAKGDKLVAAKTAPAAAPTAPPSAPAAPPASDDKSGRGTRSK